MKKTWEVQPVDFTTQPRMVFYIKTFTSECPEAEDILYGLWFNWNVELFAILRNAIQIKHSMEMWLPIRYNDYG